MRYGNSGFNSLSETLGGEVASSLYWNPPHSPRLMEFRTSLVGPSLIEVWLPFEREQCILHMPKFALKLGGDRLRLGLMLCLSTPVWGLSFNYIIFFHFRGFETNCT